MWGIQFTQGAALGYVLLPLRGVLLASFDTPPPTVSISSLFHSLFLTWLLISYNLQYLFTILLKTCG